MTSPSNTEDVGTLIARLREATGADALADVAVERNRQFEQEGWTAEHDDGEHLGGQLAAAAACYALVGSLDIELGINSTPNPNVQAVSFIQCWWPWDWKWWKPQDKRRSLVKAGALIVAEIERIDRVSALEARRQAP